MKIEDILNPTFIANGIPKTVIVGSGTKTYLFIDGKQISTGCEFLQYTHEAGDYPVLETEIKLFDDATLECR